MRKLIEYFIKFPLAANLIMVLVFAFGIIGLLGMKSNFFPNVPVREIYVDILYPGASPHEVEEGAILKIEENLKGLNGMDRITSISKENTGTITIEMLKGTDMDDALVDVKNAVQRIASFPKAVESVTTYKHDNVNKAMSFVITPKKNQKVSLHKLKAVARKVEHDLLKMDGISKIDIHGYPDEEVAILINEDKLESYQLTFAQIAKAVASTNLIMTGGSIKDGQEEFFIRARNKAYHSSEIQDIIVRSTPNNGIIRLKDIATVKDQWADTPSQALFNGKSAVVFEINNTFNEDIISSTDQIKAYLKKFNMSQDYLEGVVNNDMSVTLNQRIDLLASNGKMGIILVLIFLSLFLNPRIAFWVAIGIPFSIFGTFIILPGTSVTINMISLFALILVLGILVDDGIVIAENIFRHWQMGKKPIKAAIDGTLEVVGAVVSGVLTTVFAFATFLFLDGKMGDMFKEIAIIVILILFVSLFEGLILLPSHLAHSKAMKNHNDTKWNKYMGWAERGIISFANNQYRALIKWNIKHRTITIAIFTGLFIISIGMVKSRIVPTTFFPTVEGDNFTITLTLPSGTEDVVTQKQVDKIYAAIWQVNDDLQKEGIEDKSVIKLVFQRFMGAGNNALLQIQLQDAENRTSTTDQIIRRIRHIVGDIPGAEGLQYSGFNPFGKQVAISLVGDDNAVLQKAKEEVKEAMKKRPEISDISDDAPIGNREIELSLKTKANLLGLTVQDVIGQVRQAFWGYEAQRIQRGKDEVKVWVKYTKENRRSIGQLENMKIHLGNGKIYPLSELATLKMVNGVSSIRHLDFDKEVQVEANMSNAGASLSDIIAGLQKEVVEPILKHYPSVKAVYDGQKRETDKVQKSAKLVIPIVLILMFGIVILTLRSISQSILVYAMIPLSFIGVVFGHWVHGMNISLMSFMGIIALVGVMINDALVLISALNINLKTGMTYHNALIDACVSRLRPIFLTTATTVVGVSPMLLSTSMQARFLIPVAISLAYGLIMSTTITLVLLPVMLTVVNNWKVNLYSLIRGKKVTHEEVESAIKELAFEKENEIDYKEETNVNTANN